VSDSRNPELEALAQRLFAAARAEHPTPALGRRLLLIQPQQPVTPVSALPRTDIASSGERAVTPGGSRLARWLAAAIVLGALGSLWLRGASGGRAIHISPEHAPSGSDRAVAARSDVDEAPALPSRATTAPEPSAATQAAPVLASGQGHDRPAPSARSARARPAPADPRRSEATVPAAPALSPAPPASAEPARDAPPSAVAPSLTLLGELELLKQARAALRSGDGARALVLLDRHVREGKGSGLDAESTLLRIEALSALGRRQQASELAARFVRDNPDHALTDRAKSFVRTAPERAP
jgi:hypothetical protein